MGKFLHPVRPGGLSDRDKEMIFALAARKYGSGRIAQMIEKHPSTVQWFMYRNGLKAPGDNHRAVYHRNGKEVRPFSREDDAFISVLRLQGYGPTKIADLIGKRTGYPRNKHTIAQRLVMLASREEMEAAHG
ncbi:hypothetical protein [Labrys neptuniae]